MEISTCWAVQIDLECHFYEGLGMSGGSGGSGDHGTLGSFATAGRAHENFVSSCWFAGVYHTGQENIAM